MDVRARMKEKGPGLVKNGRDYTDNKSLLRDYITEEGIMGVHNLQCLCKGMSHKHQSSHTHC